MTAIVETPTVETHKAPRLTWHGVKTVTQLELMQRIRSTRWKTTLLLWFIGIGIICVLFATAVKATVGNFTEVGPIIFATNAYFVLFMGLLITPTLSSTAINGDRERGTLAILQASLLTPLEITLGKLAASWLAALSFLFVSLPFILWAFAAGNVSARSVIASVLSMALVLLVVCAVSLFYSARSPKTASSTVASYGFVALISVILPIIWGLLVSLMVHPERVTVWAPDSYSSTTGNPDSCSQQVTEVYDTHGDVLWPMLAVNPFVLISDAAAPKASTYDSTEETDAVVRGFAMAVRASRAMDQNLGYENSWCTEDGDVRTAAEQYEYSNISQVGSPLWPWGYVMYVAIGGLAVWRTSKRLGTPYTELPKGIRIA